MMSLRNASGRLQNFSSIRRLFVDVAPLLFIALLLGAFAATAKKKSRYTDTKKRFSVKMPRGWKLAPLPGDTSGMTFRKDSQGQFALLRVQVRSRAPGETVDASMKRALRMFRQEIGYTHRAKIPSSIGLMPALQNTFTVFANGDKRAVREVDLYVLHAFGHVHVVHFEALQKQKKRFNRDVDRMLASYKAKAGRRIYAPLIGTWSSLAGPSLSLEEDMTFVLGPLRGTFRADGGRLVLTMPDGKERFQYKLKGRQLILSGGNLDGEMVYSRSGAARFSAKEAGKKKSQKLTRSFLVGKWRALDTANFEPLILQLSPTGSVSFGPLAGQWRYERGRLNIRSTSGQDVTYAASFSRGKLRLGGGDLEQDLYLVRME
ncbi:MAG: copper resistance protein NlpE [Deltaproteobacteria bacterium]|nr:copper resistance protein NlpE [Deltaproteobacteria bacterium]